MFLTFAVLLAGMQTNGAHPAPVVLTVSNRCTVRADGVRVPLSDLRPRAEQWTRQHREVEFRQGDKVSPNCMNAVFGPLKAANASLFIRNGRRREHQK